MPTNRKENIIFGISMCLIMVFIMSLINISIHLGKLDFETLKTVIVAFPVTLIIVYILETFIVGKFTHILINNFVDRNDSKNSHILANCFFIVTFMSFIMTIIGGLLGGDNIQTIFAEFLIRWPRNFWAAFFVNMLIAGPVSRFILRLIQQHDKETITKEVKETI